MPFLTITEAATTAGVDRATIYRKIRNGTLSAVIGKDGTKKIDVSELARVFEKLNYPNNYVKPHATPHAVMPQHATDGVSYKSHDATSELVQVLKEQIADCKTRLEAVESAAVAERDRLYGMIEKLTPRQVSDQRPAKEKKEKCEKEPKLKKVKKGKKRK